ncbi:MULTISPECIES: TIGR03618 family F420-dependent PPOX class oxidoreductase [Micromonospora]|uniref:TIGR03618 family F420-dependent PPOX class oxidoreductase n=1 Tax=Micromonospora chalcea TaxID=1874 RepID=A0ABX9Y155_MICCH|nr:MULTISPECIES: TIGR03618 family F420-dependent PPOX class oxidoreductase [Micromonospora]MBC8988842.1 TIGR03618 family F420-dependent PPOX class oxidoreductase [Micromonospora chalcea]MBP1785198.1 PPOX class probable F420-dependent enzyme [Micromonospora sp. HB375]MBQ1061793.1 TIGR03618 family F420-dependent PPOX class oxidoreductase [Micromonospora sp. C41]MBQ1068355.1 TIGR03618 family F420-dependent PPOX class oxidoreductase [Micromonospora sp. D75]MDH6472488.1 PPOX class probable F420-dep
MAPSPTAPVPPAVEDRLARERNVWLCTLRRDGSPHMTPVWFVYADGVWWIGCEGRSVKARNVAADPRVSLALEDGVHPVVAEGVARLHRAGFPPAIVAAFAEKYGGWDIRQPVTPDSERVLLEVPVRRWLLAGRAR